MSESERFLAAAAEAAVAAAEGDVWRKEEGGGKGLNGDD